MTRLISVNFLYPIIWQLTKMNHGACCRRGVQWALWRRDDGLVRPRLDIVDGDDEIEIKVDLPGVERDDVEISTTGNSLQIRGEKKTEENREDKNYQLVERSFGSFVRSIPLPFAVEPKSVRAALENGVLVVKVKKPEEVVAKTHKIEIGKSL